MIGQFKFVGKPELQFGYGRPNKLVLTLDDTSTTACKQIIDELDIDKTYKCEIKNNRKKRTLDQNAFLWVLCEQVAKKIHSTSDEVYRSYIRSVGERDIVCVKEIAVQTFVQGWERNGLGWFCDISKSRLKGCQNITVYYGSSSYDTEQMGRLLDEVIADCKEYGIQTDIYNVEE